MTTTEEITKARSRVTSSTPASISRNPTILNILIKLKNNAKGDYWIKFVNKALTYLI